jgi:hypothetical protein
VIHNTIQRPALGFIIVYEISFAEADDAFVFESSGTWYVGLDYFIININFNTDAVVPCENVHLFPRGRRMKIESAILISKTYRDNVRNIIIRHTQPTHLRAADNVLDFGKIGYFIFAASHVTK